MSKTTTFDFVPSASLFSRFMSTLDGLLMAYAEANIRNGDVPRCSV